MAKVQALLRRAYDFSQAAPTLSHRGAALNTADQTLRYNGQKIALTKNEYRILLTLLEGRGRGGQPRTADGAPVGNRQLCG